MLDASLPTTTINSGRMTMRQHDKLRASWSEGRLRSYPSCGIRCI